MNCEFGQVIRDEFCGKIYISGENESDHEILWESSLITPPTGTISVYNERTSSDFLTFRIMHMKNQKTLSVSPGNSRSFTSSGLQSFQLVNIRAVTGMSQGTYSLTIHYEFFLEPCND
ncbi:Protein of unknown function [Marininema mesophilum]|uniref:Endospore appendages core domain-containing protein n=1 Tax=Marininema mesophilum TaxID=1048340 RepID=A0A1H2WN83_9BACL|nr:S-Ena type endospore appendage [Marininema mesophilum]SDW81449.1 Protein of unknown function [Marininema mesophilum]